MTPILRVVCEVVNLLLELLSAVLNVVLAIRSSAPRSGSSFGPSYRR